MTKPVTPRLAQTSKRPVSSSDWDKHRAIIGSLYVDQEKSLPFVIEELKIAHGFVATERQFKRRISRWGLDKNIKEVEMRAIIAKEASRLRQGKQSIFYVRDRQVDPLKIKRFARRKNINQAMYAADTFSSLPADIRCVTPPPNMSLIPSYQVGLPGEESTRHSQISPTSYARSPDSVRSSLAALSADHGIANFVDNSNVSPTPRTHPSVSDAEISSSQTPPMPATATHSHNTANFVRTMSDIYQYELCKPSVASFPLRHSLLFYAPQETSQKRHIATREPSPTHIAQEPPFSNTQSEHRVLDSLLRAPAQPDPFTRSIYHGVAREYRLPKPNDSINPPAISPGILHRSELSRPHYPWGLC